MCYAIPGKVTEIKDNIVTVDYFGEKRRARNDFYELSSGDYVYAQGGFVIQKISPEDAENSLKTWEEFFFKLKEIDLRLADTPKNLYQRANAVRQQRLGNACCIHGILEFSNFCRNNCWYCGIRKDNVKISRYRMSPEEIIATTKYAVRELNFKALVLQSGEDLWYNEEKLVYIVKKIMQDSPVLLILSIGEREIELYQKLYQAGSRGVLLRFETSNPLLYEKYRPGHKLDERINLIKELHNIGYLIFSGFLVGLPEATEQDILNDIELTGSLNPEMFSFGPFIPHPHTPLKNSTKPSLALALTAIARSRIMYPQARILATTALETLDRENGLRQGLLSGANSLMLNVTPQKYQQRYEIYPAPGRRRGVYPERASIEVELSDKIDSALKLLQSLGRAPTDLGM